MRKGVRIASPCSADWDKMTGDDRVRYCPQCQLNVYNFAEMPEAEVNRLIEDREGKVCAKIYRRASGTILTKDSPVAFRVLPILPGVFDKIKPATMDLLMGAEQCIPSTSPDVEQNETGIALLAYDSLGLAVPDVSICAINQETRVRQGGTTGAYGRLRFDLNPGSYLIACETSRFSMNREVVVVGEREVVDVEVELLSTVMGMVVKIDVGLVPHRG